MKTLLLSLAAAALLAGPDVGTLAFAQAVDTPPSTPSGLAATAYGARSGGVRWQRSTDDRGVRGYEIARNGTVIGVRDTLSYIDRALPAGSATTFRITAIDTAGQRSGGATVRLVTPAVGGGTPSADRPAPPAGLRSVAYSPTAGAIVWDRSAVRGLRYEVRRDGTLLGTFDATSYVSDSLAAGRRYTFEVVAVDENGQRSAPARTTLGSGDVPGNGTVQPPAGALAAPSGLRSTLYSSSAGAIAWTRATTAGLRYEVSRDGRIVTTTDGTSYVDSTLAADRAYTYAVVAIDGAGRRSAPAGVMLNTATGGATGGPVTDPGTPPPPSPDGTIRLGETRLSAPIDLRLAVYDTRSYELVWERALSNGLPGSFDGTSGAVRADRYRLTRDGTVVRDGRVTNYYVDEGTRLGGTTRYTLEALAADGTRLRVVRFAVSPTASPQIALASGTPAAPPAPDSRASTVTGRVGPARLRALANDALDATFLDPVIARTPAMLEVAEQVPMYVFGPDSPDVRFPDPLNVACPLGGSADVTNRFYDNYGGGTHTVGFAFDGCLLEDGAELLGGLSIELRELPVEAEQRTYTFSGYDFDRFTYLLVDPSRPAGQFDVVERVQVSGSGTLRASPAPATAPDGLCTGTFEIRAASWNVSASVLDGSNRLTFYNQLQVDDTESVRFDPDDATGDCRSSRALNLRGRVTVQGPPLEGLRASIARRGLLGIEFGGERQPDAVSLDVAVSDGSGLRATLKSDTAGSAVLDVREGGRVIYSVVDGFRF